jgi:energy-coupling factor transporter ATP-binding protein EcfA2
VTDTPTAARHSPPTLLDALQQLRTATAELPLELRAGEVEQARVDREQLLAQLDDYLIPRVLRRDAPLLLVVGGSTGAGKSTLVNTLVGQEVSRSGVLRPTTRSPALICNPADAGWFTGDRVLPGLTRFTGEEPAGTEGDPQSRLRLVTTAAVRAGMALLDAPDIDSVVVRNRELAVQLLGAADLWLFVTTAARYADAVPWDLLRTARDRATALAVVLDRVPAEGLGEVDVHLRHLLDAAGLPAAPLLVVPEAPLRDGLLPAPAVAPVRQWLDVLAEDSEARAAVIRATLTGAVDSLRSRGDALASAVQAQERAAWELNTAVDTSYAHARALVSRELTDGTLLRGEVLARWQELVGTGELMRTLESRISRIRDRVASAVTGRAAVTAPVESALESNLAALLRDAVERAAGWAAASWATRPDGNRLLETAGTDLSRADAQVGSRLQDVVTAWQGEVLELVRAQGGDRRQLAKLASYGVNGAGSVLIVALFAQTGGLTGGEVAIAGGTAVVSQKVLEAIFGDQAVRALAAQASDALLRHVDTLLDNDARRFRELLWAAVPALGVGDRFREVLAAVQAAR